jgi:hypothetical protein
VLRSASPYPPSQKTATRSPSSPAPAPPRRKSSTGSRPPAQSIIVAVAAATGRSKARLGFLPRARGRADERDERSRFENEPGRPGARFAECPLDAALAVVSKVVATPRRGGFGISGDARGLDAITLVMTDEKKNGTAGPHRHSKRVE